MGLQSPLLALLAAAAATSAVTGAASLASPPVAKTAAPPTRLGVSVNDEIARRDSRLAQASRTQDLREQTIRAAQARLDASLKAREEAATPATGAPGGPGASPPPDQFDSLAKIYQAMKPAKAAPVFSQLDIEVQYLVAKRMSERATAMILAAMDPEAAARLTMALAGRKPVLRKAGAGK